jgi:ribosomal protein L37AE/L43A
VADAGSAVAPAEVTKLTCPRCHFPARFVPLSALVFRCSRCEWPFTLSAPTVSTPAVPATTVAVANSSGTVVAVTISGGTLTSVVVNGTAAGTTAGTYLVPVAGTISITYSAAPTWAWALPAISAGVSAGGTALTFAPTGTNVAFAVNQVLIVDPSGTSDVVRVNGTPTATSVPVGGFNSAHSSGVLVTVAQLATTLSGVETVPLNAY